MKPMGIFYGCICFFVILLFAACDQTGTLNEVYKYPKELWGEWIRMDTGNTWYIASNYINTQDNKNDITIQKQSKNVIMVTRTTSGNTSVFYLYASRIPNGSFSGSIVAIDDVRSAVNSRQTGIAKTGSIKVIILGPDPANVIPTTTDDNGNFTADGIIPGDGYQITGDGFSIPVYPNNSGEDIGTVAVTDGANLITSISPRNNSNNIDMMRLYTGTEYQLKITVQNIGNADSRAVQYTLALPDGLEITENTTGILSTIEPGKSGEINITVTCDELTGEYEYKDIGIETVDRAGKTWQDSVSLKFNKEIVTFRVFSDKEVRGVVIVPNVRAYHFTTSNTDIADVGYIHNADIQVPKYSDDYLVVFSGATADTEAIFSLAVDKLPNHDFTAITEFWGNYVTNTSEEKAAEIDAEEPITAYLEKNDILYFKVSF